MNDPRVLQGKELREWLSGWLRMRGPDSAGLNLRAEEAPYERPLALLKEAEGAYHAELLRAVLVLIEEAAEEPWDPKDFHQLMSLVEEGGIREAIGLLERLAYSQPLLASPEGAKLHMQAVRTLLALGWVGTREFWLAEKGKIGAEWPGLVFNGLAAHDVDRAFRELPSLAPNAEAMSAIVDHLPGLMQENGLTLPELRHLCQGIHGKLAAESAFALRRWADAIGVPYAASCARTNPTLWTALQKMLGAEAEARTFEARLVPAGA